MIESKETSISTLDELSAAAIAGDEKAGAVLFEKLRVRFLAIAKRRVREDDVEDLVQDALRIVIQKQGDRNRFPGVLVWSLTILRNVIGNYYQAKRREGERMLFTGEIASYAGPAGEERGRAFIETVEQIAHAISLVGKNDNRCVRLLRAVLAAVAGENGGGAPTGSELTENARRLFPDLSRNAFYVALHRCRARLRAAIAGAGGAGSEAGR